MSSELFRKCCKCAAIPLHDETISYHRFPKPGKTNILRARAWAVYCWPEKDWTSLPSLTELHKSHKMLCGRHFEESCFSDSSKRRLSKFSVPGSSDYVKDLMNKLRNEESLQNTATEMIESSIIPLEPVADSSGYTLCQEKTPVLPTIEESSIVPLEPVAGSSSYTLCQEKTPVLPIMEEVFIQSKKRKGILKPLDLQKVSQLNDRERKLYFLARKHLKEINRLRKELKQKGQRKIESICEDVNIQNLINLKTTPSFNVLLQSQLQNCSRKKKGRRYNLDQKVLALSLYKKSPACYRLLRRLFTLPSQSTLNKLLNKVPLRTGINKHIFDALEEMVKSHRNEDSICSLIFDEMAIRKHLKYNERFDHVDGFQDHGEQGRSGQVACNALVFMLAGVRKKWKQPVAFYFSGKSVTSDRLTVLIKCVLDECCRIGLTVVSTVCDLSRINIKSIEKLGSMTENPYFIHQGREIVTILDPPHLLKCLRNLFLKYNIECQIDLQSDGKIINGIAKWEHIKALYDLEKSNANFIYAPILTEAHINPNSKQKMRVKLAAQVISHSVTCGLNARITGRELPNEAIATATITEKFDKLFDSLNADTPDIRRGKRLSTNITNISPHLAFFQEMKTFIKNLKFLNCSNLPPSHHGWIRTINAVERLWSNLQKLKIRSLSTRRLNQDPLENFFGCIRYSCGSNTNPTVEQFIAGVKTAIISNLRNNSIRKNCEDDTGVLFNNLKSFLIADVNIDPVNIAEAATNSETFSQTLIDEFTTMATEAIEMATPEAQACAYVCGFIVKRIEIQNCDICKKIFLVSDIEPIHVFTNFREYNTMQNSLNYVSRDMVHCVEFCATLINNYLKSQLWGPNIKSRCMSTLDAVDFNFLNTCQAHFKENIVKIKSSIFYICMKRYCVLENRKYLDEEKSKSLQKKLAVLKNK